MKSLTMDSEGGRPAGSRRSQQTEQTDHRRRRLSHLRFCGRGASTLQHLSPSHERLQGWREFSEGFFVAQGLGLLIQWLQCSKFIFNLLQLANRFGWLIVNEFNSGCIAISATFSSMAAFLMTMISRSRSARIGLIAIQERSCFVADTVDVAVNLLQRFL